MNMYKSVTYTFINLKSWSPWFEVEGASSSSLSAVCLRLLFKQKLSNWTSSVSKPPSIPDIVGESSPRIAQAFCEMLDTFPEHGPPEKKIKISLRNSLGNCGRKQYQRQRIHVLVFL